MNNLIIEAKEDLEGEINNLYAHFEDYDFNTNTRLNKECLTSIAGFESLAVENQAVKRFSAIKKAIKTSLFSNDEDEYKISDFDWDGFEETLEEVAEKYVSYTELKQSVEDNLTGDLTVDTATVLRASDLMEQLLELAMSNNQVYDIEHSVYGSVYVLSANLQSKLS